MFFTIEFLYSYIYVEVFMYQTFFLHYNCDKNTFQSCSGLFQQTGGLAHYRTFITAPYFNRNSCLHSLSVYLYTTKTFPPTQNCSLNNVNVSYNPDSHKLYLFINILNTSPGTTLPLQY